METSHEHNEPVAWGDVKTRPDGKRYCRAVATTDQSCLGYIPLYTSPPPPAQPALEPAASQYKQELGSKNCMQCATAYMLGVPLDDVPNFERAGPDAWEAFYAFFTDRGFTAEMFPSSVEIDGDYLASGDTERGTSHMVVMRGGKLLHDPHPSNAGLKSIKVVWLIVPRAGAYASPPPPAEPAANVCPTCGSDCNERDELIKAEREIERLRKALAEPARTSQDVCTVPLLSDELAESRREVAQLQEQNTALDARLASNEAVMRMALEALKRMERYGNTFLYRRDEQNPHEQTCEAIKALEEQLK